jgi:serine/threonine protein kinase
VKQREDVNSTDELTDVCGLGATLYYLMTGKEPFTGSTMYEITSKIITTDPVMPRTLKKRDTKGG